MQKLTSNSSFLLDDQYEFSLGLLGNNNSTSFFDSESGLDIRKTSTNEEFWQLDPTPEQFPAHTPTANEISLRKAQTEKLQIAMEKRRALDLEIELLSASSPQTQNLTDVKIPSRISFGNMQLSEGHQNIQESFFNDSPQRISPTSQFGRIKSSKNMLQSYASAPQTNFLGFSSQNSPQQQVPGYPQPMQPKFAAPPPDARNTEGGSSTLQSYHLQQTPISSYFPQQAQAQRTQQMPSPPMRYQQQQQLQQQHQYYGVDSGDGRFPPQQQQLQQFELHPPSQQHIPHLNQQNSYGMQQLHTQHHQLHNQHHQQLMSSRSHLQQQFSHHQQQHMLSPQQQQYPQQQMEGMLLLSQGGGGGSGSRSHYDNSRPQHVFPCQSPPYLQHQPVHQQQALHSNHHQSGMQRPIMRANSPGIIPDYHKTPPTAHTAHSNNYNNNNMLSLIPPSHSSSASNYHANAGGGAMARMSPVQQQPQHGPQRASPPVAGKSSPGMSSKSPVPASSPQVVYQVQFKHNTRDFVPGAKAPQTLLVGELVIVQCQRGEDLGVIVDIIPLQAFVERRLLAKLNADSTEETTNVAQIIRVATQYDLQQLPEKARDEASVTESANKLAVTTFELPMQIVDAEYQFDRQKLTIFYTSEARIDFRELVKELFAVFNTRVWMKKLGSGGGPVVNDNKSSGFVPRKYATKALTTGVWCDPNSTLDNNSP